MNIENELLIENELDKYVTDSLTVSIYPQIIDTLKNSVIYISRTNISEAKDRIVKKLSSIDKTDVLYKQTVSIYRNFINFIKANADILAENVSQTDRILYSKENSIYFVVVNECKDVRVLIDEVKSFVIHQTTNESIYIGLAEEAPILTLDREVVDIVHNWGYSVAVIDVSNV